MELTKALNKIQEIEQELIDGYKTMIKLLNMLTPEQQKEYAPKIGAMIDDTSRVIKAINVELFS